ncbi:hypothetical protein RF644_17635 [Kocuria sp. CPCC 205258]|uniref:hypothetical protein n=1 Tax=Kocuria sp. CPCC 205258 TaxID=3073552 RepID=UPI0034D41E58
MADHATTRPDLSTLPSTTPAGSDPDLVDEAYVETLVESAGGAAALDPEGIEGDSAQPVEVDSLLGLDAVGEMVTAVLAIREDHLEAFWALDNAVFQNAVTDFITDRPFLTVDDAMRAVLRSFGVRAKTFPDHVDVVAWGEPGWQLVETDVTDLTQARLLA